MSLRWKKITAEEPNLAKSEREEKLWMALKRHILLERKRKKEELEAEVEEERQRKEREAREKQDVMTLGETREQIILLESKLQCLRNEKQQLFLQLKKVLNEDDNRKRQMHKETEMFAMQQQQAQPGPHPQLFLPPRVPQQPILHKSNATVPAGLKRNRSPSPTQIPYYKPNQQPYHAPKLEENRRGPEVARAVLWNKSAQYSSPGTLFYPSNPPINPVQDSRSQPIIYPTYSPTIISCAPPNRSGGGNYHAKLQELQQIKEHQQQQHQLKEHQQQQQQSKNDMMSGKNPPPANVYHINLDQHKPHQGQPITIEKIQERGGYHHDDRKDMRQQPQQPGPQHLPEGIVYTTSMRPGQILHPHSMVPMPPNQQQLNNFQKSGGIPQNYPPNRPTNAPPNPHQQPPPGHYPRHRY